MFGICSYKELENWETVHTKHNPKKNNIEISELPVRSIAQINCTPRIKSNSEKKDSCRGMRCIKRIKTIQHQKKDFCKGWYIILLGNLKNETPALNLVLENYKILDSRTKEVRYFLPGFINNEEVLMTNSALSHKEKFNFYEDGFLETVDWLEDNNENYEYNENLNMILLPFRKENKNSETIYDFENMLYYDLDNLLKNNRNIIAFIKDTKKIVRNSMDYVEAKRYMDGLYSGLKSIRYHKIFIAGSKSLERERDAIRSSFSKLNNRTTETVFKCYTYEDFDPSLTEYGRQTDYNKFIADQADTVIFILDHEIGDKTSEEFDIAWNSFLNNQHPKIYVYSNSSNLENVSSNIKNLREKINNYNQYYEEYNDIKELKHIIEIDFNRRLLHL